MGFPLPPQMGENVKKLYIRPQPYWLYYFLWPCLLRYIIFLISNIQYVFDYQEGDVFACMSVLGWITGHTYVVYGPLCNGATTVLFEGTAMEPTPGC